MNIGQGVFLADPSEHLCGGDILNIGLNALHTDSVDAGPKRWMVMQGGQHSGKRQG